VATIKDEQLKTLAKRLGYEFKELARLRQALTHRSVGVPNNERLEFLGDSILSFIVSEALYEKFPKLREGDLTRLRSQLVKGETLAEIALEFKLDDYVILGQGEKKSGGYRRASILADAFEAIIAAIYFDSDIQTIKQCLLKWQDSRINALDPKEIGSWPMPLRILVIVIACVISIAATYYFYITPKLEELKTRDTAVDSKKAAFSGRLF